jgi:steroid delta-isomerase-like uncharacterized protein
MARQDILTLNNAYWEAWNSKDADAVARCASEDFTAEGDVLPAPVTGRDGLRELARVYMTAFPDLHFDITQQFAAGDKVVTCWTATGTHKGQLMRIPPTGRWVEVRGCNVSRFHKGKLAHALLYWDYATLLRQLGLLPVRGAFTIEREVPILRQRSSTEAEEVRL